MINPNPNHIRQPSFLPPNIILAMIDGETDTNDYDQVSESVHPPTLTIPSQNESSEGSSDNDFPPPPSTSTLKSVPLTTPVSSKNNHHYDGIGTHTTVTTTVTKIVDPPKNKSKGAIFCLLLSAAIVSALVLLLVFGWHEKFSFGNIGKSGENGTEIGQGNLTMNSFFTDMVNNTNTHTTAILAKTIPTILPTDSWISTTPSTTHSTTHSTAPTITSPSITSSTTPTTTSTTTTTTPALTFPFGWREPIKNVTAEPYIQPFNPSTTTSAPTTTITTFEEKDKNVFGNMSIFLSDKNRFVVSPFLLNYFLSYIGKFGDFSTKSAIADKYFGVNDINQMYDYFVNLKTSFHNSRNHNSWFLLNALIAGDNPIKDGNTKKHYSFMEEILERDQIPIYPSSDRSYETYYNERIKKNSYDKENNWPFFEKNQLKINGKKIIGFSHLQNSLKFKKVIDRKIPNQEFMGTGSAYFVDMFVNYGIVQDFAEHRLYQIPFADEKYTFFIVHNRFNHSIPNISLSNIIKSVKNEGKKEAAICIPEIKQQNTYEMSKFINFSVGKELSLMFDQPFDNHIIQKYYQAIRFDLRAEGLNMESREHESGTFKNCDFIDRTFIYGIFYNDKENPGHEALLYYGLFI